MNVSESPTQKTSHDPLEFTGNWYFDLGILGFVNTLDKVWGVNTIVDADFKLLENIETLKLKWLYAYLYVKMRESLDKNLKKLKNKRKKLARASEIKEIDSDMQEFFTLFEKYLGTRKIDSSEEIMRTYYDSFSNYLNDQNIKRLINKYGLQKIIKEEEKLPITDTFLRNYGLFNGPKNMFDQIKKFNAILSNKLENDDLLDKTLNKFIESKNEFANAYFDFKLTKNIPERISKNPLFAIFLVSFYGAFNISSAKRYCFYFKNLKLTYQVNKKVSERIKEINNNSKLLRVTWESIFDSFYEKKAIWALNNMLILECVGYDSNQQSFEKIEFIGLNEVKAQILLDEELRSKILEYKLLWNFLEGNSMGNFFDMVFSMRGREFFPRQRLLYGLSIEKILKSHVAPHQTPFMKRETDKIQFINLPLEILSQKRDLENIGRIFTKVIYSQSPPNFFWQLLELVQKNKRNEFVNIVYKEILKSKNEKKKKIIKFFFDNIHASKSWQYDAFGLILPAGVKNEN